MWFFGLRPFKKKVAVLVNEPEIGEEWVMETEIENPFVENFFIVVEIVDKKNGWVEYMFNNNPRITRTRKISSFMKSYELKEKEELK